jgi:hypothetical protein
MANNSQICPLRSIAVQYGKLGVGGDIEPLHKAVAAKILAVV